MKVQISVPPSRCSRIFVIVNLNLTNKKSLTKNRVLPLNFVRSCSLQFSLCDDSLSTNYFLVEANCYHCFTDWTFNFNNTFHCYWVCIKQPFIFTTWTSHLHFLHLSSPPVRGQSKGKVKLTIIFFIILCTFILDLILM